MTSTPLDATDRVQMKLSGLRCALAGMLLGLLYAAVSVYWGLGGTTLLDTVGGSLERGGRAGDLVVVLALWAAVALKVIAAVLPLLAIYRLGGARWQRLVWALAWIEAAVLVIYGLVLTIVGLMVQAGVVAASASADHRALAWHTYLWDPWFLVWGLVVTAALLRARHRDRRTTKTGRPRRTSAIYRRPLSDRLAVKRDDMRMFEGFDQSAVDIGGGVRLRVRRGGVGSPVVLLHGHPRTHTTWHRVAPLLVAAGHTVVCPDLRGYGQSAKPVTTADHRPYSKRAMAGDVLALMQQLGYERFAVVGHDRGSHVAASLALDAPQAVTRLAVLDSVPIGEALARADARFAAAWWHWFFFAQPDKPERAILTDPDAESGTNWGRHRTPVDWLGRWVSF